MCTRRRGLVLIAVVLVPCACNEQGAIAPSERTASVAATVSSVGPVPTAAPAAKQAFGKSCMASFDKQASCKDIYVKTVARGRGALGFSLPSLLDKKDEWSAACGGFEEATHVGQLTERAAALDKCSAEAECAAFATCAGDIWMSFYERGGAETLVGSLRRGAMGAFERSDSTHGDQPKSRRLCGSAVPVPKAVPRGKKYMPSTKDGEDFNTGDATTGWECLRFGLREPMSYQLTYVVGGPYKGPPEGGPDPGANGFEVAAEGDLDGDGIHSLVTWTGTVDQSKGVVMAQAPFLVRLLE